MKLLFSIEDLRGFYNKEVEHGIYGGSFERWLNESNYSLVSDGVYEYTYKSPLWRNRGFKEFLKTSKLQMNEIKNCMSIAELQRTGL